jgi:hypothetical protein
LITLPGLRNQGDFFGVFVTGCDFLDEKRQSTLVLFSVTSTIRVPASGSFAMKMLHVPHLLYS